MQIKALILLMFLISGCSIMRKAANESYSDGNVKTASIEDFRALNLTDDDFMIQKALIHVTGDGGEQKLTANLKYKKPGKYLMSLRSLTGIEAARFYITDDTILINDRINKRVYHGSTGYLMEKYGISVKYLPIIVGDLIVENVNNEIVSCNNNIFEVIEKSENNDIEYILNCSRGKVNSATAQNSMSGRKINLYFDKFVKGENINYSRNIRIADDREESTIEVTIEKISRTKVGDIDFLPGKNYEDVILK